MSHLWTRNGWWIRRLAVLPRSDAPVAGNVPAGLDLYAPITEQLAKGARDA